MAQRRIAQFATIYPQAWNHFRYEMVAAAPVGSNLLVAEMGDWLSKEVVARQNGISSAEQVRVFAPMLLRLEKLFRKLPRLPTSRQQFISKSNLWFFELRQLTIDAQERTRQAQLKVAPPLLYRLLTALLRNWVDRARQAGLTVAAITEQTGKGSDFSRQWQELLAQPYFRLLLPLILRQDLDWLAQHLRTLAQQLAQGGTGAVPTAINALNDELLQRQQNNWRLASLYASPQTQVWIDEYNRLCAYTIDFCVTLHENADSRELAVLRQRLEHLLARLQTLQDKLSVQRK